MRELTISRYTSTRQKPGTMANARAKRKRADDSVAKLVRAKCEMRDGYCRIGMDEAGIGEVTQTTMVVYPDCAGPSQWTHMHSRRRSQTRNQAPEVRHDSQHSFMACKRHHDQYDNRDKPRLYVTALTKAGADGPLKFRRGK